MARRQQQPHHATPAESGTFLPSAQLAVRLPQTVQSEILPPNNVVALALHPGMAVAHPAAAQVDETLAKRRAFIRALALQAARDLAATILGDKR